MEVIGKILTPWAPYSVMFSHDGSRLAIGGGSWYGNGGILISDLSSGEIDCFSFGRTVESTTRPINIPTVSGVCFSSNDTRLVASTWNARHTYSPTFLYELSGLKLTHKATILTSVKQSADRSNCPTGVLLSNNFVITRSNSNNIENVISAQKLAKSWRVETKNIQQHLTHSRIIVIGKTAITGGGGSLRLAIMMHAVKNFKPEESGRACDGLVFSKYENGGSETEIVPSNSQRVTAIALHPSGESFLTGGLDGEIDYWFQKEDDKWKQLRLRKSVIKLRFFVRGNIQATYKHFSIVGICHLCEKGLWVAVDASGELILFRHNDFLYSWQLPQPGSPRSIAAHPQKPWIAVGLKKGGFAEPESAVTLVKLG